MERVVRDGWRVEFLHRTSVPSGPPTEAVRLGDLLLSMTAVRALLDAMDTAGAPLPRPVYSGPRGRLMRRCEIGLDTGEEAPGSTVSTAGPDAAVLEIRTVRPPKWVGHEHRPDRMTVTMPPWLDPWDGLVDVHASLPGRYYLQLEQDLGVRLPGGSAAAPRYLCGTTVTDPGHVVLVTTTSRPEDKDYGAVEYLRVARELMWTTGRELTFTLLTNDRALSAANLAPDLPLTVACGMDDVACLDLFGTAELVIGNDTGLTHLAALTRRPDGGGPHVVGLYSHVNPLKWSTGSARHHSVATPLAGLLAQSDGDIHVNQYGTYLDPTVWSEGASLAEIPSETVAEFAAACAGWK